MFKHYFEQIYNIEVWPIISLIIFFAFFIGVVVYIFKIDKSIINKMEHLPLDEDEATVKKS